MKYLLQGKTSDGKYRAAIWIDWHASLHKGESLTTLDGVYCLVLSEPHHRLNAKPQRTEIKVEIYATFEQLSAKKGWSVVPAHLSAPIPELA